MNESRREFIAASATLAAGSMLPTHAHAAAGGAGVSPTQHLSASTDLRLATFSTRGDRSLRTGAVLDDGRVVDIGAEARRRSMRLVFDPASMLSLIAADDGALRQVRALTGDAAATHKLAEVVLAAPIPTPSVTTTDAANVAFLRSVRSAKSSSDISVSITRTVGES